MKMKEKEFVIAEIITGGEYDGMLCLKNPRNLREATEEDIKNEKVYTISETMYNNAKKWLIFNYDKARYKTMIELPQNDKKQLESERE